ncbi:MAG TPA: DEAD/DEAH box helicase, partial [Gemmatimonadales bacterium]|nr:DEAD/DEAH box helicase [Gemmatimonadales bacterium]
LLGAARPADPREVARQGAAALLDGGPLAPGPWPPWLAPHQIPAAARLAGLIARHGGALLADAVGLGKSYIALALIDRLREPTQVVVPAVLVPQWRSLLAQHRLEATLVSHQALSRGREPIGTGARFIVVDEAHHFRNPRTRRYRSLATMAVGARLLLVTATPVTNRPGDLLHLLRLFLRDDALTALGVPSLAVAARERRMGEAGLACVARLTVARSRERVRGGYAGGPIALRFPARAPGRTVRAPAAAPARLATLAREISRFSPGHGAAAMVRIGLLHRLASSLPAFEESLARHRAFADLAREAARDARALTARDFERLFPREDGDDLQLAFLPLLLPAAASPLPSFDDAALDRLRRLAREAGAGPDPKADALERLLAGDRKTIVFTSATATVRHLARRLRGAHRVVTLSAASRDRGQILKAFAPLAQGAAPPAAAMRADVLITTDVGSEGLNLQDASRVIHYDLPWTPARLAQRVGRVDRLGAAGPPVETVSFLPPREIERALRLESRLAAKAGTQGAAGAAQIETVRGAVPAAGLDWCDRLQTIADGAKGAEGCYATIAGVDACAALVARIGGVVEAVMVDGQGARSDPAGVTAVLEEAREARGARAMPADGTSLADAIRRAAPLLRERLNALALARWRATDRQAPGRRLIPLALATAQNAARRGNIRRLALLDALVARLARGMTAGEELELARLLERRAPLRIADLIAWHRRLPPLEPAGDPEPPRLAAAILVRP